MDNIDWDKYFMSMVFFASMKSKDNSTKIGAVITTFDNAFVSMGFNGLARGVKETPERNQRPEKYLWYAHGERNAIYAAARIGAKTDGCRMYTNGCPCCGCAIACIQSGIREVVVSELWTTLDPTAPNRQKWLDEAKRSMEMFAEAGVALRSYRGDYISEVTGCFTGKDVDLKNKCLKTEAIHWGDLTTEQKIEWLDRNQDQLKNCTIRSK